MPESQSQQDDGAGLRAALLFLTGVMTIWAGYTEYQKYRSRRFGVPRLSNGTYPGRVVRESSTFGRTPQGVPLNPIVGDETLEAALTRVRSKAGLAKRQTVEMKTVEERVNEIGRLIRDGSLDDDIKDAATAVLTRKCGDKWCTGAKDYAGESDALFEAVVDPKSPIAMRYTLDHPTVDEFSSAKRGLRMRAEDCDGLSVFLGSLLASVGHRPEIVIMQAKGAPNWSHIFLREPINLDDGVSKGGARYRYLDPSMQSATGWQPPGWVPPGVEAALAGHPGIGITQRARAFRLF